MKLFLMACALYLTAVLPASAEDENTALGDKNHAQAHELPGQDPIGKPSDRKLVTRTIEVNINETEAGYMLFEPNAIHVEHGSVVGFIVKNDGELDHELFLGSFDEVAKHQQWIRNHPDTAHDNSNVIAITSGETAELVWEFSVITNLEFACLIPGHREAGMWGVIVVHDGFAPKSKG